LFTNSTTHLSKSQVKKKFQDVASNEMSEFMKTGWQPSEDLNLSAHPSIAFSKAGRGGPLKVSGC
jgi:hypothetical protein